MKAKYVVKKESGYDVAKHCSSYETVRTFRNEPEAMAFCNDPKNQRMCGMLFLERRDAEGGRSEWNSDRKEWVSVCAT